MEDSNESPRSAASGDWQQTAEDLSARTQNLIREAPGKVIGLAVVSGLLLTILPLGWLFGALVRVIFSLIRPLLLVLGAVKIYEEFEKKQKS